jgi:hypothetical protein
LAVPLDTLLVSGCSGKSNDRKTSGEARSDGSATTVYSMDVVNGCAGFGAAQAAEFLAVPAAEIESRSEQVTPTTRGCSFSYRGDQTRQVGFTITREDSIDDAKHSFASYRETVSMGSRVQQSATGEKPAEGAYVDILGVGDEAVWRSSLTRCAIIPTESRESEPHPRCECHATGTAGCDPASRQTSQGVRW